MVVNLLLGIEKAFVLRQGWSILKDISASKRAVVLILGSTDLRPGLLSGLHIHH